MITKYIISGSNCIQLSFFSFNNIIFIYSSSQSAFIGLLALIKLNLSSNALEHIPNEAFTGLVSLRTLDLSGNLLEKLDNKTHGLLDDCLSLEEIDLSNNRISILSRKMFPTKPYVSYRVKDINLSYNLISIIGSDLLFGTRKVERLNLSHNQIKDIRTGKYYKNLIRDRFKVL